MSIQRSSCEGDNNKDRLFVYTKENDRLPQSTAIGIFLLYLIINSFLFHQQCSFLCFLLDAVKYLVKLD